MIDLHAVGARAFAAGLLPDVHAALGNGVAGVMRAGKAGSHAIGAFPGWPGHFRATLGPVA